MPTRPLRSDLLNIEHLLFADSDPPGEPFGALRGGRGMSGTHVLVRAVVFLALDEVSPTILNYI